MYYVRTTNGGMMAITPRATAIVAVKKNIAASGPVVNTKKTAKKR